MLHSVQTSSNQAMFTGADIKKYALEDEIDILQIGQTHEVTFEKLKYALPEASVYSRWPTKDDPSFHKFNGFWLELSPSLTTIER